MKRFLTLLAVLCFAATAHAQNIFKAIIQDGKTGETLMGASANLVGTHKGATANSDGLLILTGIPDGVQIIQFRYMGYQARQDTLRFPLSNTESLLIQLFHADQGEALEQVTIAATRSSRTIANIPTRVEFISGEELDEKSNMKPGDIRVLLAESTGIQTQQTSATSANASIRIQGLDGKYTQMIRDGFPLYSGFSGGLGLLQIAPLDLKRVEVVKGSASTLYGGGAIAGLVNLVSKTPSYAGELNFLLNATSAGGADASMFYGQKFKKMGATIYAAYNYSSPYDPANIDLTAIPKYNRYMLNPKIWWYFNKRTTLQVGVNATIENRLGGDLHYIEGNGDENHSYFEENKTGRYSTQVQLDHHLNKKESLSFKNSVSYFDRSIGLPAYRFSGQQVSSYTELGYSRNGEKVDWVFGLNYLLDHFGEVNERNGFPLRNYTYHTLGGFVQSTRDLNSKVTLEGGVRGDYNNQYGFFLLPRASALWKISEHLSTRLGGGIGYKVPTIFTEDAERIQFRNVLPIDVHNTQAEWSYGANYDINYRIALLGGKLSFSINQLFFYTRIDNPIILTLVGNGNLAYHQMGGNLDTKGMETNVKLGYADFKLLIGYTLADVKQHVQGVNSNYPLVSRHRLNNVLLYEIEDQWKIGAEAYCFSPQLLSDGSTGKSYWTCGLMAEKLWKRFSVFVNFENIGDTRQTRFDAIYTGSVTNPVFKDIYAPLDGFVVNGGVKMRL